VCVCVRERERERERDRQTDRQRGPNILTKIFAHQIQRETSQIFALGIVTEILKHLPLCRG